MQVAEHAAGSVEIRIWKSSTDSFEDVLYLMNKSHNFEITQDWLITKLGWGKGGLGALAYVNEQPVGLALLGSAPYRELGKPVDLMWSLDNFIVEEYRGRGIYHLLLKHLSQAADKDGIQLILTFPNLQSRPGFERAGWSTLHPMWAHVRPALSGGIPRNIKRFSAFVKSRKSGFQVEKTLGLTEKDIDCISNRVKIDESRLEFDPSYPAIEWRFHAKRAPGYRAVHLADCSGVFKVGLRGNLREAQLLATFPRQLNPKQLRNLFSSIRSTCDADLVTMLCNERFTLNKAFRTGIWPIRTVTTPLLRYGSGKHLRMKPTLSGIDLHLW